MLDTATIHANNNMADNRLRSSQFGTVIVVVTPPRTGVPMLKPLARDDVPEGLVFSLGWLVEPGSRLVFLGKSDTREGAEVKGTFQDQSRASLEYISGVAHRVSEDARIVKVRRFMTAGRGHRDPETGVIWNTALPGHKPASTALEIPGSSLMDSRIDLEAWAIAPGDPKAPELSRLGEAGSLPDAVTIRGDQRLRAAVAKPAERPLAETNLESDLLSCLEQLEAEFAHSGASRHDIAKLTVYHRDVRSWPAIRAMLIGRYGEHCPVVVNVVVSNLMNPDGYVEVSGWARCDGAASKGSVGNSGVVDLRDQLAVLTGTGALPIFIGGQAKDMYQYVANTTIEEQVHIGMANQKAVLESAGAGFEHVFRSNWYLTDIRDWPAIEPIVTSYFDGTIPTPMVIEVSRLTAKQGVRFEPDLWASLPSRPG